MPTLQQGAESPGEPPRVFPPDAFSAVFLSPTQPIQRYSSLCQLVVSRLQPSSWRTHTALDRETLATRRRIRRDRCNLRRSRTRRRLLRATAIRSSCQPRRGCPSTLKRQSTELTTRPPRTGSILLINRTCPPLDAADRNNFRLKRRSSYPQAV